VPMPLPERDFFWNLAHAPTFGLLGVLLARALAARPLPAAWPHRSFARLALAVLAVALWAGIDEVHQGFVPGRNASPFDFATDVTGAACALWVAAYALRADAGEGGLRWRLLAAVALCALAAAASTARDRLLVS